LATFDPLTRGIRTVVIAALAWTLAFLGVLFEGGGGAGFAFFAPLVFFLLDRLF